MEAKRYVRGIVLEDGVEPPTGLPGLEVQLRGGNGTSAGQILARAVTDTDGRFVFDLGDVDTSGVPWLLLRVYDPDTNKRLDAHGTLRWLSDSHPGPVRVRATLPAAYDEPSETPPAPIGENEARVFGRVRHDDGSLVTDAAGLRVRWLGITVSGLTDPSLTAEIDENGWYQLAPPSPTADFFVRLEVPGEEGGPAEVLAASRPQYGKTLPLRLDLDVDDDRLRQPSEFSRITADCADPLGDVEAADVNLRGVAVLSGKTDWDVERLGKFVAAHRLARNLSADPELIYGLLRTGWPASPRGILSRAPSSTEAGLRRAVIANYIRALDSEDHAAFAASLVAARKAHLNAVRGDTLGDILRSSGELDTDQVSVFVGAWVDREGTEAEFWAAVPGLAGFTEDLAAKARRLVTLGIVGLMYAPAVESLLTELDGDPAATVATFTDGQWTTIASSGRIETLPYGLLPEGEETARQAMARLMREHAEELFPGACARHRLLAGLASEHPGRQFLSANAAFDLAASAADDPEFTGTSDQRKAAAKLQRLYLVSPFQRRGETLLALEAAGYTGAHAILRGGRLRFLARIGGTIEAAVAGAVYARAAKRAAGTLAAFLQFHPRFAQPGLAFLPGA